MNLFKLLLVSVAVSFAISDSHAATAVAPDWRDQQSHDERNPCFPGFISAQRTGFETINGQCYAWNHFVCDDGRVIDRHERTSSVWCDNPGKPLTTIFEPNFE